VAAAARVLAGFHAVAARLRAAPDSIEVILIDGRRRDGRMQRLLDDARARGVSLEAAAPQRLRALAGEVPHQGVVALAADIAQVLTLDDVLARAVRGTLLLALDEVTDPRNLGACLRVADAAGVDAVIVPRDRSAGLTTVATKAAAGAAESVPLIEVTNLARALDAVNDAGILTVGAAGDATASLYQVALDGPVAWVLGAEGSGLRRLTRERCATLARIPLRGSVDSLNVSVASGICLFETLRQRGTAGA
jgi:23S rRNA (guanosine2251-2'-O)-methyltransferase